MYIHNIKNSLKQLMAIFISDYLDVHNKTNIDKRSTKKGRSDRAIQIITLIRCKNTNIDKNNDKTCTSIS